jgi:hypothetical protein
VSNSYVSTAFVITTTEAEAHLACLCFAQSEMLRDRQDADRAGRALDLERAFVAAFPPLAEAGDDPLSGFKDLFEDQDYFELGCTIEAEPRADGITDLWIAGHQIQVETVARIVQRSCPSALPFAFEWACYSDRLRRDEFGGGYALVAADKFQLVTTSDLIGRALADLNHALETPPSQGRQPISYQI